MRDALYPDTADVEDFSYERVSRLLRFVAGEQASPFRGTVGIEEFSERIEPHPRPARDRMWYGAGACGPRRAGENGLNYLSSNASVRAEQSEDFAEIQRVAPGDVPACTTRPAPRPAPHRASWRIPTDSATPEQAAAMPAYAQARTPRTATPQAPHG